MSKTALTLPNLERAERKEDKRRSMFTRKSTKPALLLRPRRIPLRLEVIQKLCSHIQIHYLDVEGIFRLSGTHEDVLLLHNIFDQDIDAIDLENCSTHDVTGALKHYLREQPVPLIPFNLFDDFMKAYEDTKDDDERMKRLLACLDRLPPENKPIFARIWRLLADVALHVEKNKMNPSNLGIVFGPTLMRAEVETPQTIMHNSKISSDIFTLLIKNHERVTELLPTGKTYRIFKSPPALTDSDWTKILTNAKLQEHSKDSVVLEQGVQNFNLYRISSGRVRVEIGTRVVAQMGPGEVFGELSFLGRYETSATVVADENHTLLHVIALPMVRAIFQYDADLLQKFYFNLAHKLAQRLQDREEAAKIKTATMEQQQLERELKAKRMEMVGILESRELCQSLRLYLKEPRNAVVAFWNMLQAYRSGDDMIKLASGKAIFDRFVQDGAQLPAIGVKLDPELVKRVKIAVFTAQCEAHTFDDVEVAVVDWLTEEVLAGFRESEYYEPSQECSTVTVYSPNGEENRVPVDKERDTVQDMMRWLQGSKSGGKKSKLELFLVRGLSATPEPLHPTTPVSDLLLLTADLNKNNRLCLMKPQNRKKMQRAASSMSLSTTVKQYPCKLKTSGILAVNQHELVFTSKILGRDKKLLFPFKNVEKCAVEKPKHLKIRLIGQPRSKEFIFKTAEVCDEAHGIIIAILQNYGEEGSLAASSEITDSVDGSVSPRSPREEAPGDDLEDEHWDLILLGGREMRCAKGEIVLREEDELQRIYQIVEGTCIVRKKGFDEPLAQMQKGATFGEMSFLMGGGATASVEVSSDEATIFVIEAEYFKRLFNERPELAGRWFKYLATVLMMRFKY